MTLTHLPLIKATEHNRHLIGFIEQGSSQIVIRSSTDIDDDDICDILGCSFYIRTTLCCEITNDKALYDIPFLDGYLEKEMLQHMLHDSQQLGLLFQLLQLCYPAWSCCCAFIKYVDSELIGKAQVKSYEGLNGKPLMLATLLLRGAVHLDVISKANLTAMAPNWPFSKIQLAQADSR